MYMTVNAYKIQHKLYLNVSADKYTHKCIKVRTDHHEQIKYSQSKYMEILFTHSMCVCIVVSQLINFLRILHYVSIWNSNI